jgi:hypothetical protein
VYERLTNRRSCKSSISTGQSLPRFSSVRLLSYQASHRRAECQDVGARGMAYQNHSPNDCTLLAWKAFIRPKHYRRSEVQADRQAGKLVRLHLGTRWSIRRVANRDKTFNWRFEIGEEDEAST